jgi:hypothetical protein
VVSLRKSNDVFSRLLHDFHERDPMHLEPVGMREKGLVPQDVVASLDTRVVMDSDE